MSASLFNKIPRNEALEAATVTPGQDSLWRRAGLLRPELGGPQTQRQRWYTKKDFFTLRWLKQFVDDTDPEETGLGLPITTMQALVAGLPLRQLRQNFRIHMGRYFGSIEPTGPDVPLLAYRYIDATQRRLKRAEDVAYDYFAHASRKQTAEWLARLNVWYFAKLVDEDKLPESYDAERKKLFDRLEHLEQATRLVISKDDTGNAFVSFSPALEGDRAMFSGEEFAGVDTARREIAEKNKLIEPLMLIYGLEEDEYEEMVASFAKRRQRAGQGVDIIAEAEREQEAQRQKELESATEEEDAEVQDDD